MEKTPESNVVIRFPDCDPFNHLNNSRYLDYFMNAREDHLATSYDFRIYEYAMLTGKSWVVAQNQIAYLQPALLMEKVCIQSTVLKWGQKDLLLEMRMLNEKKNALKAVLWTRFAYVDINQQKSILHEPEITDRFIAVENPLETEMTFDERVRQLRGSF